MTVREYAKSIGFEVVGKLKRLPDIYYSIGNKHHYPLWIDEAGNEYCGGHKSGCYCIITADGGVL